MYCSNGTAFAEPCPAGRFVVIDNAFTHDFCGQLGLTLLCAMMCAGFEARRWPLHWLTARCAYPVTFVPMLAPLYQQLVGLVGVALLVQLNHKAVLQAAIVLLELAIRCHALLHFIVLETHRSPSYALLCITAHAAQ